MIFGRHLHRKGRSDSQSIFSSGRLYYLAFNRASALSYESGIREGGYDCGVRERGTPHLFDLGHSALLTQPHCGGKRDSVNLLSSLRPMPRIL